MFLFGLQSPSDTRENVIQYHRAWSEYILYLVDVLVCDFLILKTTPYWYIMQFEGKGRSDLTIVLVIKKQKNKKMCGCCPATCSNHV